MGKPQKEGILEQREAFQKLPVVECLLDGTCLSKLSLTLTILSSCRYHNFVDKEAETQRKE